MTLSEIKRILLQATEVRIPKFDPNTQAGIKVTGLENYIALTAYTRSDLERSLYWIWEAEKALRDRWDAVEGYEHIARSLRTGKDVTQENIKEAKRQIDPETYGALRDCLHIKEHLGRQIRRLEKDFEAASRMYTLMTGGS